MVNHLIGFHPSLSALVLRLVLAAVFIAHGRMKLFGNSPGPKGAAGYFAMLGIPFPAFSAYVVGIVEFFGGVLLILGVTTRIVAALLAVDMLVALVRARFKTGLVTRPMEGGMVGGYEVELMLFATSLVLVVFGAGKFSVDFQLFQLW